VERATLLYQWYCTTLPILHAGHAGYTDPWRELDSFRFIPPSASHRYGFNNQSSYVSRHIRELELLSPKEVLRAEHEAIAWTQRAMFSPSPSLLLADLSLGVPNPVEVVNIFDFLL
jgi:sacsin